METEPQLDTAEIETQPGKMLAARNKLIHAYAVALKNETTPYNLTVDGDKATCMPSRIEDCTSSPFNHYPGTKHDYLFVASSSLEDSELTLTIEERATQKTEKRSPAYSYTILDSGSILRANTNGELEEVTKTEEKALIRKGLAANTLAILQANAEPKYLPTQLPKKHRSIVGLIAMTSALTLGAGYLVWSDLIDKPGKADDARRSTYDLERHTLNSEPSALEGLPYITLLEEEFADIPTYKDGDTLLSPRQIQLDENGCALLPITSPEATTIAIAVSEHTSDSISSIGALQTSEGLFLCTPEAPTEKTELTSIAIQLTPTLSE